MFTFNLTVFDADFIFSCWGISITLQNYIQTRTLECVRTLTSFSCSLPIAPLIFAENASFGFFLSGAGNFIIDTFLETVEQLLLVVKLVGHLFKVSS